MLTRRGFLKSAAVACLGGAAATLCASGNVRSRRRTFYATPGVHDWNDPRAWVGGRVPRLREGDDIVLGPETMLYLPRRSGVIGGLPPREPL